MYRCSVCYSYTFPPGGILNPLFLRFFSVSRACLHLTEFIILFANFINAN